MKNAFVRRVATVTALLVWLYLALVLLLGTSVGSVYIGLDIIAISLPVVGIAAYFAARFGVARGLRGTILRLSVASFVSVSCLFVADMAYSFFLNSQDVEEPEWNDRRQFDPTLRVGELYPPRYFPTAKNFRILKPGVSVSGSHRGEYYQPELLKSPALASILAEYPVTCTTDEHGFRNRTPMGEADIFVLGDSFAFGWAVDAEDSWVGRLERGLGRPIYNLGIPGSSPKQELGVLKYVLESNADSAGIRQLLWLIYEGNDLDDSYAELAPAQVEAPGGWQKLSKGTVLDGVQTIPWHVQGQSILHRLLTDELTLHQPALDASSAERYLIDGIRSSTALFQSPTLGPRLFFPGFIEQAAAPASFVLEHPNRPRLDAVFAEVARLSDERSFEVTVVIVPTAARLHGQFYEGFPPISDQPHFADYVTALSTRTGFRTLDLLPFFAPYANRELLYLRDDEHWNARGNAVAAEIIQREIFP